MDADKFEFNLGEIVTAPGVNEAEVIGKWLSKGSEPQYYLRWGRTDGGVSEQWFTEGDVKRASK